MVPGAVALDFARMAASMADTVLWVLFGLLLGGLALWFVDAITHHWFDLKKMGNDPRAVATFAAGVVIAIAIVVAGVISSP